MKKIAKSYPVATFFVLTFLITGGAALLTRLMTEGVIPRTRIVPAIAPFGPSLAGVILMAYLYGTSGCRYLISRLNPRRMGWSWMILCVLLPPCLLLLVVGIHAAVGGESLEPHWFTWPNLITGTLWSAFLGAGLTEEFGWRGFALPHLQRSRSACYRQAA